MINQLSDMGRHCLQFAVLLFDGPFLILYHIHGCLLTFVRRIQFLLSLGHLLCVFLFGQEKKQAAHEQYGR